MRTDNRMVVLLGLVVLGFMVLSMLQLSLVPAAQALGPSRQSEAFWLESDDPLVVQSGTWDTIAAASASGGSYLRAAGQANTLTLSFTGSLVEITYATGSSLGTLAIEIDNTVVRTVVATADSAGYDTVSIDYLSAGTHVLEVYAAEGTVGIDAFYAAAIPTEINPDAPAPPDDAGDDLSEPEAATINTPSGKIYSSTPVYKLTVETGDTHFFISVIDQSNGQEKVGQWYLAATYCAAAPPRNCSIQTLNVAPLRAGVYKWKAKTWNGVAESAFSAEKAFEVQLPTGVSPLGLFQNVSEPAGNPSYRWNGTEATQRETWYELLVVDVVGSTETVLKDLWFEGATINCTVQCDANPSDVDNSFALYFNKTYGWYLRAWGPDGYGPWTSRFTFTLDMPTPLAIPQVTAPQDGSTITDTYRPEFAWIPAERANYYNLIIQIQSGPQFIQVFNQWFSSAQVGCYVNPYTELVECGFAQGHSPYVFINGTFRWRVVPYGPGGLGPATDWQGLTINVQPTAITPPQASLGQLENRGDVTFIWGFDDRVEWYNFLLRNSAGTTLVNRWFEASTICEAECTVDLGTILAAGLPVGNYNWNLVAWNGDVGLSAPSANKVFTITSALTPAPNPATFKPPTTPAQAENHVVFEWGDVANATWYNLYVEKVGPPNTIVHNVWYRRMDPATLNGCPSNVCSIQPALYLGQGNYRIWIGAWGVANGATIVYNGTVGTFSIGGGALGNHTYTSPIGGAVVTNPDPNFVWTKGANALYYEFWLGRNVPPLTQVAYGVFSTADDGDPLTCNVSNVCTLDLSLALKNGNYAWYIRGYAPGSPVSNWDAGQTFVMNPAALPGPQLDLPFDTAVSGSVATSFSWQGVQFGEWYEIQFLAGTTGATVLRSQWFNAAVICVDQGGGVTLCTGSVINPPLGTNRWQVRGWSSLPTNGFGNFSAQRTFTQLDIATQ